MPPPEDPIHVDDGQDCSSDSDADYDDAGSHTAPEDGIIVPIAEDTVERIVAGQAVSDLSGAVKELIDNALDAGASSIIIKLVNQGLDLIEVSDDGGGVPRTSRPLLAMKHATSKIRTFDDFYRDTHSGQNLGFRGEALFCLANLSENLVVSTRAEGDDVGEKLEFGTNGYVRDGSVATIPRKVGTTVSVVKLFHSLPVRRTDLMRRIKAQRARLMKMMQGYAILCLGVRFNLIDVVSSSSSSSNSSAAKKLAKSDVKLQTSERSVRFEETVSSVLGSKFLSGLCRTRIDLAGAVRAAAAAADAKDSGDALETMLPGVVRVEGLISKAPKATSGQALARDLQFFSVNGRPVELPKISRLIGDVWRMFDTAAAAGAAGGSAASKKRPACILSFFLPNNMYDVNLSPDKREVLLNEETTICDLMRDALTKLWSEQTDGTFVLNEVETMSNAEKSVVSSSVSSSKDQTASAAVLPASSNEGGSKQPEDIDDNDVGVNVNDADADAIHAANGTGATLSVTPEVPSPQRRRMRRRNAFVNHFGCIGNNAPDAEYTYGPSEPAAVRAQTPQALRPSSDVSVAERRNWEQTRLHFNKADSSQQDEIAKLAAMSSARSTGSTGSAASAGDGSSDEMDDEPARKRQSSSFIAAADEPEKESSWKEKAARKSTVKKRKHGEASFADLEAFAFDVTGGAKDAASNSSSSDEKEGSDDDDEEDEEEHRRFRDASTVSKSATKVAFKDDSSHDEQRVFTKAIGQDHSPKQFKRHRVAMRRNSIFRTLEVSVALKDAADAAAAESESSIGDVTSPPSPITDRNANTSKPQQAVQDDVSNVTSESSGVTTDGGWAAAAAAVGRRRVCSTVQEPRGGSADQVRSPKRRRDQEPAALSPQKKIPPTPEPISWSHFGGTAAVVNVARDTRLRMESSRRLVKESQEHRQEEDGANEADASLGPTSGQSVGINDGDEKDAPKPSKTSKKSSKKQKTCRLTHADFESMDIIGQFNLGFILARCRNNHLWILDQHACDEKFNFERLCATTTVHEQKLIAPLPLELSPSEESCVLDNMDIFEKNGFRFRYDSKKPPRHRLSLTALPHSGSGGDGHKAVQFGKEDVGALCAILGADGASSSLGLVAGSGTGADGSGLYGNNAVRRYAGGNNNMEGPSIVRLPKAVAMFASRACRSSIMIGTALSEKELKAVVRKMKDVVQPWDCAHGRPTIRHVTDILQTMLTDERAAAQHIAGPNLAAFTQAEVDDDDDAE